MVDEKSLAGDNWDFVAYDPEHKLVLEVVPGKRTAANTDKIIAGMKKRTEGKLLDLISSDEYKPYSKAILKHYGKKVQPERKSKVGRTPKAILIPFEGLNYVVVHKTRENGKVTRIEPKIIFGEEKNIVEALLRSKVSRHINTSFIERYNGTDRHQNARKGRCTYEFSKKWEQHNWLTYFVSYSYNFCWAVRTLRTKNKEGKFQAVTPAMAAKLTDHVWLLEEWMSMPSVQLF